MQELVPRSVLKQVVASSNDRRQWGVLAAAWIGVSERELMQAVARHLKVDFFERVPAVDVSFLVTDPARVLEALRRSAAVPVMEGGSVVRFISVDPAEVRGCPLFDGRQELAIGCWSDISLALDLAERSLAERERTMQEVEARRKDDLSRKVIEVLVQEAAAHGATSVEVLAGDDIPRYQFVTLDGKRGHGNIHKAVISDLTRYLAQVEGTPYESASRGSIVVRSLGSLSAFRLSWIADASVPEPTADGTAFRRPPAADCDKPRAESEDLEPGAPVRGFDDSFRRDAALDERVPVMVVDDNPMFCRVLERLLHRDGYVPWFAENGEVALEKLEGAQNSLPRAIICDLHMPVMNGKELLAKLRSVPRYASIPVVMLTSDDDVEAEVSLLGTGADAFVSKTKDPRILCAQVRRLTQSVKVREAA
jgi:CheY-like chemotaxis protein